MKVLENSYAIGNKIPLNMHSVAKQEWLNFQSGNYYCKYCGSTDSAVGCYSEMVYGTANVINIDGDMDDYESGDGENFDTYKYTCRECGEEEASLHNLVTADSDEGWEVYKRANGIVEETITTNFEEEDGE